MSAGAEYFERLPCCLQSESHHFHRDRCALTKPVHELGLVDNDGKPVACGRNDFLAQQRATQSFDQIERAAFHLIRPIYREVDLAMLAEGRQRNVRRLRLRRRALGGGNADKAQALLTTPCKGLDCEGCRRAGTETYDHIILNQLN